MEPRPITHSRSLGPIRVSSKETHPSATIASMENHEIEPVEPAPLPTADNQPTLVVDLPDGQKLVVGNLDPGTVVEVATWRGTGRPDSRTNRLMLGVSNNEASPKVQSLQSEFSTPQAITAGAGVTNSTVQTGVSLSNLSPATTITEFKKPDEKRKRISSKAILKVSAYTASVAVLIGILAGPLGIRVAHPQGGAQTAVGKASASLVLTRPITRIKVGQSVIATLPATNKNPVIAVVSAVSEKSFLLSTNGGYAQVSRDKVAGRVAIVLPFIGYIANLFS